MCFFFFQAEDGIRDGRVTGVQTCALPISQVLACDGKRIERRQAGCLPSAFQVDFRADTPGERRLAAFRRKHPGQKQRSEERRVGKECRSRWSPVPERRKKDGKKQLYVQEI